MGILENAELKFRINGFGAFATSLSFSNSKSFLCHECLRESSESDGLHTFESYPYACTYPGFSSHMNSYCPFMNLELKRLWAQYLVFMALSVRAKARSLWGVNPLKWWK